VGWSLPEVFVLAHAFSDKENTAPESSKNKDFCIRPYFEVLFNSFVVWTSYDSDEARKADRARLQWIV